MGWISKEKIKHYIKEIVLFIIAVIIISNGVSYFKSSDLNKQNLFTTNFQLIEDQKFKYDPTKPLLIHFWATWCPICKIEAANIQAISKDYQVLTIAVDSGDDKKLKKYLELENINFKVVNDTNKELANRFNISVYPTTFIYDKNRELVFSEVGYTSTIGLKLRMFWASF